MVIHSIAAAPVQVKRQVGSVPRKGQVSGPPHKGQEQIARSRPLLRDAQHVSYFSSN